MRQRECVRILLRIQLIFPNCRGNQAAADCAHGTLIEGYTHRRFSNVRVRHVQADSAQVALTLQRGGSSDTLLTQNLGCFPTDTSILIVLINLFLKGKVENHTDTI